MLSHENKTWLAFAPLMAYFMSYSLLDHGLVSHGLVSHAFKSKPYFFTSSDILIQFWCHSDDHSGAQSDPHGCQSAHQNGHQNCIRIVSERRSAADICIRTASEWISEWAPESNSVSILISILIQFWCKYQLQNAVLMKFWCHSDAILMTVPVPYMVSPLYPFLA